MDFHPDLLLQPDLYPHPVDRLRVLETHISWVVLTGEWAYKLKKPVNFGFLDYSSLERRKHFCHEEIRLNRRLAPGVYVDVVALNVQDGKVCIDGPGLTLEYAVRMRQFPQSGLYDRQLSEGRLGMEQLADLGRLVAHFHGQADRASPESDYGNPGQVLSPCLDNFTTLYKLEPAHRPTLEKLVQWTEREWARLKPRLEERKRHGFIRELHGDLHLGNVAEISDRPVPFDGIEFDPHSLSLDGPRQSCGPQMHGLSGSGKTFHSQRLLQEEDMIRLRSDVLRKSRHGLAPEKTSGSALGQGIYSPDQNLKTYQELADRARDVLRDGHSVVVDATCLMRTQRELFRRVASEMAVPFQIVTMQAPVETLRQRIVVRQSQGGDASEANLAVLQHQLETQEAIAPDETGVLRFPPMAQPTHWTSQTE